MGKKGEYSVSYILYSGLNGVSVCMLKLRLVFTHGIIVIYLGLYIHERCGATMNAKPCAFSQATKQVNETRATTVFFHNCNTSKNAQLTCCLFEK